MKSNKIIGAIAIGMALASFAPVFAEDGGSMGTSTRPDQNKPVVREIKKEIGPVGRPEVVGKVTSISGTTLMVSGKVKKDMASTTYTVNASGAVVLKGGATSTVSNIAVGDLVVVQGTISGTNVTAKLIRDANLRNPKAAPKPGVQGDGQPVIGGLVTSVSGSSFVLNNGGASSTSYTVNAENARIMVKGKQASSTIDIKVGDRVIVQGAVNGTSITATSVLDQGPRPDGKGDDDQKKDKKDDDKNKKKEGFFGGVGGWFKRLFGF